MSTGFKNAAARKPKSELKDVIFSDIGGIHPVVDDLFQELDIPVLKIISGKGLSESDIRDLMTSFPIRLAMHQKRWYCAGNVRMFLLAEKLMPPSTTISCIVDKSVQKRAMKTRVLKELVFSPVCVAGRYSDIPLLAKIMERGIQIGLIEAPKKSLKIALAELYGSDVRRFKNIDIPHAA